MLSYAEDRNTKISIIKAILKKKQEHALPLDLPRDLILEAKVRLGNEKKSDSSSKSGHSASIEGVDHGSGKDQILQVEKELGMILSDHEIGALAFNGSGVTVSDPSLPKPLHCQAGAGHSFTGSGEKGFDPSIPNQLQVKDAASHPHRAETWSSLFSSQAGRPRSETSPPSIERP